MSRDNLILTSNLRSELTEYCENENIVSLTFHAGDLETHVSFAFSSITAWICEHIKNILIMPPCIHNNVAMNCSHHVNAIFYNYCEKQVIKCYGNSKRIRNHNYPSLARNACFYATTSNRFREPPL